MGISRDERWKREEGGWNDRKWSVCLFQQGRGENVDLLGRVMDRSRQDRCKREGDWGECRQEGKKLILLSSLERWE